MSDNKKDITQTFYKSGVSDDDRVYSYIFDGFLRFMENKINLARKNDYIINKLITKTLTKEDISFVVECYKKGHHPNAKKALENINTIALNNYLPIGSWSNIPPQYIDIKDFNSELVFAWLNVCIDKAKREYADKKDWLLEMIMDIMAENRAFGYSEKNFEKFAKIADMNKKNRAKIIDKILSDLNIVNRETTNPETSSSNLLHLFSIFVSTKIARAIYNDYFLAKIYNKELDDKDIEDLKKIYNNMSALKDEETIDTVLKNIKSRTITLDNYLPLGSWKGVPQELIESKNLADILTHFTTSFLENPEKLLKSMQSEAVEFVYPSNLCFGFVGYLGLSANELAKIAEELTTKTI